jgi:hypothetical protein
MPRDVLLDRSHMQIDDNLVNLAPGMAVTVGNQARLTPLLRYKQEPVRTLTRACSACLLLPPGHSEQQESNSGNAPTRLCRGAVNIYAFDTPTRWRFRKRTPGPPPSSGIN